MFIEISYTVYISIHIHSILYTHFGDEFVEMRKMFFFKKKMKKTLGVCAGFSLFIRRVFFFFAHQKKKMFSNLMLFEKMIYCK